MEAIQNSSADRVPVKRPKSKQRSKVANGTSLWAGTDGRSLWARRAGELLRAHIGDLGGDTNISEAERALAKRAAVLITELERRESVFASANGATDEALAIYQTSVNSLRRLLETLGLQRRARDVSLSLSDILREAEQKDAAS